MMEAHFLQFLPTFFTIFTEWFKINPLPKVPDPWGGHQQFICPDYYLNTFALKGFYK